MRLKLKKRGFLSTKFYIIGQLNLVIIYATA